MTEKEKKKLVGTPAVDVQKLLKELNTEGAIEKMREHDIDE